MRRLDATHIVLHAGNGFILLQGFKEGRETREMENLLPRFKTFQLEEQDEEDVQRNNESGE